MKTQDGYDWPTPHKRAPMLIGIDTAALGRDRTVVRLSPRFARKLTEGETFCLHPAGGIIVAHPMRKPLWCYVAEDGSFVQEWVEL